jgi:putative hydrolase of the HAD superfamily
MIRTIIFDLDNTLIDFWKFKTKSVDAAINAMIKAGLKMKKGDAMKIIHNLYRRYGMEYKYLFQELLKKSKGRVDYRILSHALVAYRKTRGNLLVSYKGVKPTLRKLKKQGYKLAIISDAPKLKAWIRLVSMGIDEFFDAVITFDDTGKRKPNNLPFRKTLEKMRIKPHEALMVGDSIKRDMIGAKAMGIKTVFAKYGYIGKPRSRIKEADFEIERIEDLFKVLGRLK